MKSLPLTMSEKGGAYKFIKKVFVQLSGLSLSSVHLIKGCATTFMRSPLYVIILRNS
jgi:hypothetical protein